MLNTQTIETIQSTIPLLEEHGRTITDVFYKRLFENHPFLKNIFNMANQAKGGQSQVLSEAVVAYAKNIDNLGALLPVVERIAHKHVSLGVEAEHYDVVGENLLIAIQEVLGLPDNHAALGAWGEAYGVLADVFINAEKSIYNENKTAVGGWEGFRDFSIDKIVEETPDVKSFYFSPVDLEPVSSFSGGQYIGVKTQPKNSENQQIRQYSLSQIGSQAMSERLLQSQGLRISVKAEPEGLVSNHFHQSQEGDVVSLQAPTGVFTLTGNPKKSIFIAGGVGITPLMSMLQESLDKGVAADDLLFIQCARNEDHQIFKNELTTLKEKAGFQHKLSYDDSDKGDHQGYLNVDVIKQWLNESGFDQSNSEVYFCGPKPFMSELYQIFNQLNYSEAAIHYEVFGPTTSL